MGSLLPIPPQCGRHICWLCNKDDRRATFKCNTRPSLQNKRVYLKHATKHGHKATKNSPLRKLRQTPSCRKVGSPGARISKVLPARLTVPSSLCSFPLRPRFEVKSNKQPNGPLLYKGRQRYWRLSQQPHKLLEVFHFQVSSSCDKS